jgi:hypothetical protein
MPSRLPHDRGVVLPESTLVRFEGVSQKAYEVFESYAKAFGVSVTDLVNWSIGVIGHGCEYPEYSYYWRADGAARNDVTTVWLEEVIGEARSEPVGIKLTDNARRALAIAQEHYECDAAAVFAWAASIAPYSRKKGGILVFGTPRKTRWIRDSSVFYIIGHKGGRN